MCPSSRFLRFLVIIAAVAPAYAEAGATAPGLSHPSAMSGRAWAPSASPAAPQQLAAPAPARPQFVRPLPPYGQRIGAEPLGQRIRVGRDERGARRYTGGRRGFFGGGFGYGVDATSIDVFPPPQQGFEGGLPGFLPRPTFGGAFAPPPRCPLVIKVGHGLLHPARTQVISGHPACI